MALLLLSLLSLFLFAVPAVRAAPPEPVYDTDGHPLRRGESYYVLPVIRGGGLTLAQRHRMCPLYVAQEPQEVKMGLPVTFSPVDSAAAADDTVRLSTDVNVRFDVVTVCVQSTVWRLGDTEGGEGRQQRRFVATGGVQGSPGPDTVSNWFKIEKFLDRGYKIEFCPSVCRFCKVVCGDVGVVSEDGKRLLGLSDAPFPVMFKNVKSKA
ncbi:kunitz trypsin inhibitor 2-like [Ananas comosus]|uniref:Kunitz trypsin inhibitor 2-like n=1 Tax=Ananas comosus TaxID=4615 RepID=A0A6P5EVT3_ANACO|nr:kunitz trypsin inhibitor 2-like [Ananas comosus]